MTTKETRQKAEAIRGQVADILGKCQKIANTYEQAAKEYGNASALFKAWQWFDSYEARTYMPEESTKAKETRENSPREWARIVRETSDAKECARVSLFVARVNLINFLNYAAESVAELLRPFWRSFALRKGWEELGEILTPKNSDFKIIVKVSGGNVGAQLFPSSFIRLTVYVKNANECGKIEGVKMGEAVPDDPREIIAPNVLTLAKYERISERLEAINQEARRTLDKLTAEARQLVRSSGLYGFAEFLASYHLNISK